LGVAQPDNEAVARQHTARRRTARRHLLRTLVICALLVAVYYLAPVEPAAAGAQPAVRAAVAIAGLMAITTLVGRLVVRLLRNEPGATPSTLAVALVGGVVLFAFVDYLVAVSDPGQFHDLETKTDALYFAVTTLATVGYGDVHATGQLARALVTVQQVYNLAVITTGATVLIRSLTDRAR
jgi:voltage-gated potassium channel